jgi:hypothetical protein
MIPPFPSGPMTYEKIAQYLSENPCALLNGNPVLEGRTHEFRPAAAGKRVYSGIRGPGARQVIDIGKDWHYYEVAYVGRFYPAGSPF